MSFLEATRIYVLCLIKMSSGICVGLIVLMLIMVAIRFINNDKSYFTKLFKKLLK